MRRRDLFVLPVFPILAGLPLFSSGDKTIVNGVVDKNAVRATPINGVGESATYYDGRTDHLKHLNVGTWRVLPGQSPHNIHTHPEEEVLVFTEGAGEISIDGKRYPVASGSVMYCAANLPHGVYNTGHDIMLFYFVKWIA